MVATPSGGDDGSSGNNKCPYDPNVDYAFVYASKSLMTIQSLHACLATSTS